MIGVRSNTFHSGYVQTGTLANSEESDAVCGISSGYALFAMIKTILSNRNAS